MAYDSDYDSLSLDGSSILSIPSSDQSSSSFISSPPRSSLHKSSPISHHVSPGPSSPLSLDKQFSDVSSAIRNTSVATDEQLRGMIFQRGFDVLTALQAGPSSSGRYILPPSTFSHSQMRSVESAFQNVIDTVNRHTSSLDLQSRWSTHLSAAKQAAHYAYFLSDYSGPIQENTEEGIRFRNWMTLMTPPPPEKPGRWKKWLRTKRENLISRFSSHSDRCNSFASTILDDDDDHREAWQWAGDCEHDRYLAYLNSQTGSQDRTPYRGQIATMLDQSIDKANKANSLYSPSLARTITSNASSHTPSTPMATPTRGGQITKKTKRERASGSF